MVQIPFHVARLRSKLNRAAYSTALPFMMTTTENAGRKLAAEVYSFSCERDLPEQAACIFSFLKYVGIPEHFYVVSDGSYTERSQSILRRIDPCVEIVNLQDIVPSNIPEAIASYAEAKVLGKKLALIWSINVSMATIYMDADILFFEKAAEIAAIIESDDDCPRFLTDVPGCLDTSLLRAEDEGKTPINSGLMIIKKPLNWELALGRLSQRQGPYDYFTEQTMMHITLHESFAQPLDKDRYIVRRDDKYKYADCYSHSNIAMRHYVGPIRHKFWQSKVWR